MKITRGQLRQIIREEKEKLLIERGDPALAEIESELRYTLAEYIDTYMMSMNMNPGDIADRKLVFRRLEAIAAAIMG